MSSPAQGQAFRILGSACTLHCTRQVAGAWPYHCVSCDWRSVTGHMLWAHCHKTCRAADVQALPLISAMTALIVLPVSVMTCAGLTAAIAAEMHWM